MLGLYIGPLKSEPVDNSAIEAKRLAHRAILLDHMTRNDREIAVRRIIVRVRQQFEYFVEDTCGQAVDRCFRALHARDEYHVIALLCLGVEFRNYFGAIL